MAAVWKNDLVSSADERGPPVLLCCPGSELLLSIWDLQLWIFSKWKAWKSYFQLFSLKSQPSDEEPLSTFLIYYCFLVRFFACEVGENSSLFCLASDSSSIHLPFLHLLTMDLVSVENHSVLHTVLHWLWPCIESNNCKLSGSRGSLGSGPVPALKTA